MQGDGDKLNRWAEHFKEVVNCQFNVDVVSLNVLPIVPFSPTASTTPLSDEDLSASLSKVEIRTAISKLRPGRAPAWIEFPWRC